jgi:hypothetical protein
MAPFKWIRGQKLNHGQLGQQYLGMKFDTGDFMLTEDVPLRSLDLPAALDALAAKQLSHPNLAQFLGYKLSNQFITVFWEGASHRTLKYFMEKKKGPVEEDLVRFVARQLVLVMEYIVSEGVSARVTPETVVYDPQGVEDL